MCDKKVETTHYQYGFKDETGEKIELMTSESLQVIVWELREGRWMVGRVYEEGVFQGDVEGAKGRLGRYLKRAHGLEIGEVKVVYGGNTRR